MPACSLILVCLSIRDFRVVQYSMTEIAFTIKSSKKTLKCNDFRPQLTTVSEQEEQYVVGCMHEIIYSAEYQQAANLQVACHTTQNGQNKCTKILSHEITIFGLKMMVESGLDFFYFEILRDPSEIPANLPGQFSHYGQIQVVP